MTSVHQALLQLLSKALFGRPVEPVDIDWDQVLDEAAYQAVVQVTFSAIDPHALPAKALDRWKAAAATTIAKNVRVINNHELLHKWMSQAGIPYVILKGCASAAYYPVPAYRSMGDVDFLVPREYVEKAGRVLEENGLKPWNEAHIAHIVYRKIQVLLEMHFDIAGMPHGEAGEKIKEYTKDIFEKATAQNVGMTQAVLPSPFHHGLILLLHTAHHMTGEGIGLRHLCDWAVFENRFSDAQFCALFEKKLKQVGLWRFAQILTALSIRYLGAEKREWADISNEDDLLEKLMDDIFHGGDFGVKDSERSNQAYIISSRGKSGVGKRSLIGQFFVSLNEVVYTRWPFAKKWKIVLPAGWVLFSVKQLVKIIKGKRKKVHLVKMVEGAKQRKKIYSRLKLYEEGY